MDTAALFDRLGSARRVFSGTFQMAAAPVADSSFDASVDIVRGDATVCFEGSFRHTGGAPIGFWFTLPLGSAAASAPSAQLSCAPIGELSGPLLLSDDGFEFIASTPSLTVTLNLRFTQHQSLLVKGMVLGRDGSLGFSASPVADPQKRANSKVFAIRPIRQ